MRYTYFCKVTLAKSQNINSVVCQCEENHRPQPSFRDALVSMTTVCRRGVPQNTWELGLLVKTVWLTNINRAVPNSKGQYSTQRLEDKHVCYTAHDLEAYRGFHSSSLETVHHWAADRPPVLSASLHHIA